MRSAAGRIVLKIVILLSCIACVITKALTDQLSRRVFLRNQKLSREWGLLHNLYWTNSGNAFANVTYGGFTLITVLMLISRFIDAKSRPTLVEKIFLTVGMLCFIAMGGLVFSAFDQVPSDLHVNAIVLGCLSFFVAFLMLIDLADPMARHISGTTQTDFGASPITAVDSPPQAHAKEIPSTTLPPQGIQRNAITVEPTIHATALTDDADHDGKYARGDQVDLVQAHVLPSSQQPVFEKVLLPEKLRPHRLNVQDPRANTARLEYSMQQQPPPTYGYNPPPPPHQGPNNLSPQPHSPPQHHQSHHSPTYSRNSTYNHSPTHRANHQFHAQSYPYNHHHHRSSAVAPPQSNNYLPPPNQRNYNIRQHSTPPTHNLSSLTNNNNLNNNHHNHQQPQRRHHQHQSPSSSCRRPKQRSYGYCNQSMSSSGDEDNNHHHPATPIQPGFVAHAARFWDNRAKQNDELNTIV